MILMIVVYNIMIMSLYWCNMMSSRCCQYICELERAAFAAMQTPRSPTTVESNVTNILLKSLSDKELYDNHLLEPAQARSVLSLLSGMVESVCDQACDTLSWHELKTFVQLLCNTVRKGLGHGGAYGHCHLSKSNSLSLSVGLQLRWIADVLTRFAADDQRPLLHLVILWSMASETLVQARGRYVNGVYDVCVFRLACVLSSCLLSVDLVLCQL